MQKLDTNDDITHTHTHVLYSFAWLTQVHTHLCYIVQVNFQIHLFSVSNIGQLLSIREHLSLITICIELCQKTLDLDGALTKSLLQSGTHKSARPHGSTTLQIYQDTEDS